MDSENVSPPNTQPPEHSDIGSSFRSDNTAGARYRPGRESSVNTRLEDALERVSHGAVVSLPAMVLERGLTFAFTAILTNVFAASSYGLFALARKFQEYLISLASGFKFGLTRFLPNAESAEERNVIATIASFLMLGIATVFGAALFLAAPFITQLTEQGILFQFYIRLFAVGMPAASWVVTVTEIFRGLEEVTLFNLTLRIGLPTTQLAVGGVIALLFHDLVLVTGGVILAWGLVGVTAAVWLAYKGEIKPKIHGQSATHLCSQYVQFTVPLFISKFAITAQRYGFYPLIAFFLSGVAGGVFVIGVLIGTFVKFPLLGINQFISPVAATLYEQNHHEALLQLYQVTSRLILVGATGVAIPLIIYRGAIMSIFGPTFVDYAHLLPAFIVGQYAACAAGSVGILLKMTDNQHAVLLVNTVITVFLVGTAVPLTVLFGLQGIVATYLLMLVVNNGVEITVLYYLEDLQPFTRLHAKPLLAAVPLVLITLVIRMVFPLEVAPLVGTLFGLVGYGATLNLFGFTRVEGRLVKSLFNRYRDIFENSPILRSLINLKRNPTRVLVTIIFLSFTGGLIQVVISGQRLVREMKVLYLLVGGVLLIIGSWLWILESGNYC